jgi:hypothetical protein
MIRFFMVPNLGRAYRADRVRTKSTTGSPFRQIVTSSPSRTFWTNWLSLSRASPKFTVIVFPLNIIVANHHGYNSADNRSYNLFTCIVSRRTYQHGRDPKCDSSEFTHRSITGFPRLQSTSFHRLGIA